ncbi:XRE family transcriptional regulator [Hydrogenophaga sp. Root209]|uniref:response regulator n=1 Tax=unclassified Hydrogenophaga TaxID=2610897 RepID=UPI0007017515|nr:response regulator [Hydrogenophaga sp. Root209]KRC12099.1 XRE family transcriptional regulator [Hydrogenophaga sp. Root209]
MTDPSARPIQLLVVDDHSLFRRGLTALLSQDPRFEVSCEAGDVGEALRCLARQRPDVILLDNHLPGVLGVDAIPSLREAAPGTRVLMLTVSENEADLVAALKAGADGYLLKTVESHHLCEAIVKVMDGESVVSPEMTTKLVSALRSQPPAQGEAPGAAVATTDAALASLSVRELEILHLIARGDSNKHIARQLDIAETTVKIHVQHILRKLHLTSRVQAAVFAARHA